MARFGERVLADTSVSIREVASAAAVSVTTVSRVLNDTGPVREDTRRRVLAAIARLGYTPHGAARSLITRQTRTIGVILPDIYGEFFSELIRGADLAARRSGYHLLVSGAHADLAETREVLRTLHGRVDGLVLMASAVDARALDDSLPATMPIVLLNDGRRAATHSSIRIDNRGGARAMTRHLIGQGHRRIGFIEGPEGNDDAAERRMGYREALAAHGLTRDAGLELPGDFTEKAGHDAGRRFTALTPRPTAVFAANDAMAIGCLAGLRDAGLRVPEDVALAGFDDIPIARYMTPPLTTVHVAIEELGGGAIARLVGELERNRPGPARHELLPATLVVRGSTSPASGATSGAREPPSRGNRGGRRP